MQNSGESEFSDNRKPTKPLTLSFWQSFILTLAGAAGFISLVADGPRWLTYSGFVLVIVLLLWIIYTERRRKNK